VDQLALWNALRHDLERARMLVELVRKREKLKREQLRLLMITGELQLRPLNHILRKALDRIARKDPAKIFAVPGVFFFFFFFSCVVNIYQACVHPWIYESKEN